MVKKALTGAAQHPAPLALHPTSSAPDLLLGPQLINTSSSDPSILTISSHFSLMHSLLVLHWGHGPGRCWERGKRAGQRCVTAVSGQHIDSETPTSLPEVGLHLFLPQLLAHWTTTNLPLSALQLPAHSSSPSLFSPVPCRSLRQNQDKVPKLVWGELDTRCCPGLCIFPPQGL